MARGFEHDRNTARSSRRLAMLRGRRRHLAARAWCRTATSLVQKSRRMR
jgi:hypothetical protein